MSKDNHSTWEDGLSGEERGICDTGIEPGDSNSLDNNNDGEIVKGEWGSYNGTGEDDLDDNVGTEVGTGISERDYDDLDYGDEIDDAEIGSHIEGAFDTNNGLDDDFDVFYTAPTEKEDNEFNTKIYDTEETVGEDVDVGPTGEGDGSLDNEPDANNNAENRANNDLVVEGEETKDDGEGGSDDKNEESRNGNEDIDVIRAGYDHSDDEEEWSEKERKPASPRPSSLGQNLNTGSGSMSSDRRSLLGTRQKRHPMGGRGNREGGILRPPVNTNLFKRAPGPNCPTGKPNSRPPMQSGNINQYMPSPHGPGYIGGPPNFNNDFRGPHANRMGINPIGPIRPSMSQPHSIVRPAINQLVGRLPAHINPPMPGPPSSYGNSPPLNGRAWQGHPSDAQAIRRCSMGPAMGPMGPDSRGTMPPPGMQAGPRGPSGMPPPLPNRPPTAIKRLSVREEYLTRQRQTMTPDQPPRVMSRMGMGQGINPDLANKMTGSTDGSNMTPNMRENLGSMGGNMGQWQMRNNNGQPIRGGPRKDNLGNDSIGFDNNTNRYGYPMGRDQGNGPWTQQGYMAYTCNGFNKTVPAFQGNMGIPGNMNPHGMATGPTRGRAVHVNPRFVQNQNQNQQQQLQQQELQQQQLQQQQLQQQQLQQQQLQQQQLQQQAFRGQKRAGGSQREDIKRPCPVPATGGPGAPQPPRRESMTADSSGGATGRCSIIVSNLPVTVAHGTLYALLSRAGSLQTLNVDMPLRRAIATYGIPEDAVKARRQFNKYMLDGSTITVVIKS